MFAPGMTAVKISLLCTFKTQTTQCCEHVTAEPQNRQRVSLCLLQVNNTSKLHYFVNATIEEGLSKPMLNSLNSELFSCKIYLNCFTNHWFW